MSCPFYGFSPRITRPRLVSEIQSRVLHKTAARFVFSPSCCVSHSFFFFFFVSPRVSPKAIVVLIARYCVRTVYRTSAKVPSRFSPDRPALDQTPDAKSNNFPVYCTRSTAVVRVNKREKFLQSKILSLVIFCVAKDT